MLIDRVFLWWSNAVSYTAGDAGWRTYTGWCDDSSVSGLDIDALRIVSEGARQLQAEMDLGVLVITHYQRILNYITPEHVHIMMDGRVVESGGPDLALRLEEHGYDWLREKNGRK